MQEHDRKTFVTSTPTTMPKYLSISLFLTRRNYTHTQKQRSEQAKCFCTCQTAGEAYREKKSARTTITSTTTNIKLSTRKNKRTHKRGVVAEEWMEWERDRQEHKIYLLVVCVAALEF